MENDVCTWNVYVNENENLKEEELGTEISYVTNIVNHTTVLRQRMRPLLSESQRLQYIFHR